MSRPENQIFPMPNVKGSPWNPWIPWGVGGSPPLNLGKAEFPQGGFTPPEDVQCKGIPMESVDSMGMVPATGVEPVHPQGIRDFKSRVSANSTTPAPVHLTPAPRISQIIVCNTTASGV